MALIYDRLRTNTADDTVETLVLMQALTADAALPACRLVEDGPPDASTMIRMAFVSNVDGAGETALDVVVGAHNGAAEVTAQQNVAVENTIKTLIGASPLRGETVTVTTSGLDLRVEIGIRVDETITVVADPGLTKTVRAGYYYDTVTETFDIALFEKTDGEYGELLEAETHVVWCGPEYQVVGGGTTLTEV